MAVSGSLLDIRCGDDRIKQVVEFRYLSSTVENTGSNSRESNLGCEKYTGRLTVSDEFGNLKNIR